MKNAFLRTVWWSRDNYFATAPTLFKSKVIGDITSSTASIASKRCQCRNIDVCITCGLANEARVPNLIFPLPVLKLTSSYPRFSFSGYRGTVTPLKVAEGAHKCLHRTSHGRKRRQTNSDRGCDHDDPPAQDEVDNEEAERDVADEADYGETKRVVADEDDFEEAGADGVGQDD